MTSSIEPDALLMDTCAAIWLANQAPMREAAVRSMVNAGNRAGLFVSVATAWEVGQLSRRARASERALKFLPDARTWFQKLLRVDGIRLAELTPDIAIGASHLPGDLHRDPADRFIVATARHHGIPLVTRDAKLIEYAQAGHVRVITC